MLVDEKGMFLLLRLRGGVIQVEVRVNTLSIPNIVLSLHIILTEGRFRFLGTNGRDISLPLRPAGDDRRLETKNHGRVWLQCRKNHARQQLYVLFERIFVILFT